MNKTVANRIIYFLKYLGIFLLIWWQAEGHPVSKNSILNLSYHLFAFVATLIVWGIISFYGGAAILMVFKQPPPLLVFGFFAATLLAVTFGRMQIDVHLREKAGVDTIMIEDFEGDSFH